MKLLCTRVRRYHLRNCENCARDNPIIDTKNTFLQLENRYQASQGRHADGNIRLWANHNPLRNKATIHQVTTMLATSKYVLFAGHNHLLTIGTDNPTLRLIKVSGHQHWWLACRWLWPANRTFFEVARGRCARVIIKMSGHQYRWLAGGSYQEIGHFYRWLAWWLRGV